MKLIIAALSLAFATGVAARTFTVKNSCSYTIWPAFATLNTASSNRPKSQPAGWKAPPGSSVTFESPDNWASVRIWGRTGCDSTGKCVTGECAGGIVCTGFGVGPQTLFEFSLSTWDNLDFYDVSVVDGFNLPMTVTTDKNCTVASCPVNLNAICPAALRGPFNPDGSVAGCKSACGANLDGHPNNSPNCCSGSYNTAKTCPSSGVQDYSFFKNHCRNSYCYPFDESSGTALWACNKSPKYTVTFCP